MQSAVVVNVALLFTRCTAGVAARARRRTVAAAITLLAVVLIVVLPFIFISAALINEALAMVARFQSPESNPAAYFRTLYEALPSWIGEVLARFQIADFDELQTRLAQLFVQGSQLFATQALRLGRNPSSSSSPVHLAYVALPEQGRRRLPGCATRCAADEHQRRLTEKFTAVVRATVKGNFVIAVVQGTLGGLAFWFLDIRGPLLWALTMGFLSLVPAIGAAMVWLPVALYLLAAGDTASGIGLIVWGAAVIGLVDNLLRPALVGRNPAPHWGCGHDARRLAAFGIHDFVLAL